MLNSFDFEKGASTDKVSVLETEFYTVKGNPIETQEVGFSIKRGQDYCRIRAINSLYDL